MTSAPEGLAVELAVRDWSRRDSDVAGRLRRADNRRLEFVRSLFRQFCADENDVDLLGVQPHIKDQRAPAARTPLDILADPVGSVIGFDAVRPLDI